MVSLPDAPLQRVVAAVPVIVWSGAAPTVMLNTSEACAAPVSVAST